MKNLANEIVAWLKDYAVRNNRKSWAVGVSGGVDSALVSTLCAMTELPTHCVILPCESKNDEIDRAVKHITWLRSMFQTTFHNVVDDYVDLTDTFKSFQKSFDGFYDTPLGRANSKSRLRMIALYQVAIVSQGLVVGTGNKVEDAGIGFCTKYGDNGIDISPIIDLTKTEVRAMSRALGISPELSEAVPTDGLWEDGRTDEDALGATYDELEWAMKFIDTQPQFPGAVSMTPRQLEVLNIYNKWHTTTRHKFDPIPSFKRK